MMFKIKSTYSQLAIMFVLLLVVNFIIIILAFRQYSFVPAANQIASLMNIQIKSIELLVKGKNIEQAQKEINNTFTNAEIDLVKQPKAQDFPDLKFYRILKNKLTTQNNAKVLLQAFKNSAMIWVKPQWSKDYWIGIEFQPFVRKTSKLFLLIFVSLLFLSFIAAYFFSRYMLKPFKNLAKMASAIIEQKADAKTIKIQGTNEVKEIAQLVKTSANQIQQLSQEKEMLLAGVSHDLRTPLARMQLQAEFINDEETRQALIQEITEMDSIIGDFVTYVRSGTIEESQNVNIVSLIKESIQQFAQLGHFIEFNPPINVVQLKIKPISVKRMLTNIYENAYKYGEAPVVVTLEEKASEVIICIVDSGDGVEEAQLVSIFDPFVMAQTVDNAFGSGLGLSIVKKLAQQNNAQVTAGNKKNNGLEICIVFKRK